MDLLQGWKDVADPIVAGPDISTIDTSVQGPDLSTVSTSDDARKTFIMNHPLGPDEGDAALKAAEMYSHVLHPAITAQNPEIVSQEMYGKPLKPLGFFKKLKNTNDAAVGHRDVNKLAAQIAMGGHPTPEQIAKLQERVAALPDPKTTFQGLPLDAMKFMY